MCNMSDTQYFICNLKFRIKGRSYFFRIVRGIRVFPTENCQFPCTNVLFSRSIALVYYSRAWLTPYSVIPSPILPLLQMLRRTRWGKSSIIISFMHFTPYLSSCSFSRRFFQTFYTFVRDVHHRNSHIVRPHITYVLVYRLTLEKNFFELLLGYINSNPELSRLR